MRYLILAAAVFGGAILLGLAADLIFAASDRRDRRRRALRAVPNIPGPDQDPVGPIPRACDEP